MDKKHVLLNRIARKCAGAADLAASLLYPPRCMFCGELLEPEERERMICAKCAPKLPFVGKEFCLCCGKALGLPEEELCGDCRHRREEGRGHIFDSGRSLLVYTEEVSELMARYKFLNRRDLAPRLAEMTARELWVEIRAMEARALVPVPLHPKKLAERGFDQAKLFAEELAKALNREDTRRRGAVPAGETRNDGAYTVYEMLARTRPTKPMKELDGEERTRNLAAALALAPGTVRVSGRVILVDDIYTTGSTLDACAGVLKRAGVRKVFFVTAATGKD